MNFKVAIIGYGYWGPKLARNFNNSSNFSINKIIDLSNKRLRLAKKDFNQANIHKNYRAIKDKIDLVVISTPTNTHFKISEYFLKKKINILVEKPLCTNVNKVKKLDNLAKKNKCKIFVDYPFIFSASIKYIKKIIKNKRFGKLLRVESYREQAPIRNDVNVIWDLAVHDISILYFLLKKTPIKIKSTKLKTKKIKNYDSAYTNLSYANKMEAFIKTSWISPEKIRLMKFKFQNAEIICDENEPIYKIKVYTKTNNIKKNKLSVPELNLNEPLSNLVRYISHSLKNNTNTVFSTNFNQKITNILERF